MLPILENTSTPCAFFTPGHTLLWMNKAYEDLAGYAAIPALLNDAPSFDNQETQTAVRIEGRTYLASQLWLASAEGGYLLTLHPATQHNSAAPKNTEFLDSPAFHQQLEQHARKNLPFTLLLLTLDGLLPDTTELDDVVIRGELGALLRKNTRAHDILGDLGDNSFGLLLPGCTFPSAVGRIGKQLLQAVPGLFEAFPSDLLVTAPRMDIGAAMFPHHGDDAEQIIHAAEGALALAQQADSSDFYFFEPAGSHSE